MSQSSKRKRTKGWGKRRGFNGKYDNNDFSDNDISDQEDLQAAISTAYSNIEEAKVHDKTSFEQETKSEREKRLNQYIQKDGSGYAFPGITTYMWNNVEWVVTFNLAGLTGTRAMLPMLMRRQCTLSEKVVMIEMNIMRKNLKSMNCSAYIWKDAEQLMKTHFRTNYEEAIKSGLIVRRVFSGGSDEIYEGMYNGDKDALLPSSEGLPLVFNNMYKKNKNDSAARSNGAINKTDSPKESSEASLQSTRDFNSEMLKDRKSFRQVFYDTHTRLVQIPQKYSIELIESRTKGEMLYPAAPLPNQFVEAYTEYTPEEMAMLPVDTITKWHVTPAELFPAEGEDSGDEAAASDVEANAEETLGSPRENTT